VFYGGTKAEVEGSIKQAQAPMAVGAPRQGCQGTVVRRRYRRIESTLEAGERTSWTKVTYATLQHQLVLADDIRGFAR
jgi:hypothetical protein